MCGIAGYLGAFEPDLLARMNRAQGHRGPDGSGERVDGAAGLAHVRLSILDLSGAAAQPMASSDGRVLVSFNGEIYNFRELRRALELAGSVFRGSGDTEVLAELLAREGVAALSRLNGIFALAAWFPAERRFVLARDAAGVKPLYWASTPAGPVFASEIKALREVPGVDWSPDADAVRCYMSLLYAPGELTPVRGVRKVLPGQALEWRDGAGPSRLAFAPRRGTPAQSVASARQVAEEARHYLGQAVSRQLVADVEVGGFLSGGVDSTAVAHYAVRALGDPARYPCFTLAPLQGVGGEEGFVDDHPYAVQAATALGVPLHVAPFAAEAVEDLDFVVRQLDEPTADLAPFTTHAICRAARARGIKVLLSGAGGDDLFSGYRRHRALDSERWWGWWPRPLRGALRTFSGRLDPASVTGRRLSKLFRYADASADERLAGYFLWTHDDVLAPALSPAVRGARRPVEALLASLAALPASATPLGRMLHLEKAHFLADHNLNYTDKMAMACGVEVRVPFLDPDLVAFSERLPDRFKQRGSEGKYALRLALRGVLPDAVLDRPKTGFGFPLRGLMRGPYAARLRAAAADGRLDAAGIFDREGVLRLLEADVRGEVDAAFPLLAVLFLESWFRQHGPLR
ncbi:MAG: asparagine synthase (glutamine-hydrolyzing) [Opitutales bacterium]